MDELLRAFLFGCAIAAAPGPIVLLIVTRGMTHGAIRAAWCAVGAALGDGLYGLIAFLGGAGVHASVDAWVADGASGWLWKWLPRLLLVAIALRMAARGLATARGEVEMAAADSKKIGDGDAETGVSMNDSPWRELGLTLGLTLANPTTVLIFVGFLSQIEAEKSDFGPRAAVMLAMAVFAGSLVTQLSWAIGGSRLSRLVRPPHARAGLYFVTAAILLGLCL